MVSIGEMTDLHLWKPVDAEALVRALFVRDIQSGLEQVHVISEITPDINKLAQDGCILYDCAPARSVGGGYWRFALSVYVFCTDPDIGAALHRTVWQKMSRWAYGQRTVWGKVMDVSLTGFGRNGPDKWNLARDVHMWAMEDVLIRAYSGEHID